VKYLASVKEENLRRMFNQKYQKRGLKLRFELWAVLYGCNIRLYYKEKF
jgi:hypothetical protein